MAFMVPVMKNEFNIYKTDRNRRISECSNSSSCRSRKVSESSRSEGPSLSTSPASDFCMGSPSQRNYSMNRNTSRGFSRNSSRTSQNSLMSPTKTTSVGCSPPKPSSSGSQGSLNKFHNRLVDKLKKTLRRDGSREESRS
ncbi:uncharacterized protein LOC132255357 [Phlebotomus argentipes]|uniref:uncharacterized protein LOC132255357 n=1 Tax=Phlebotomus argentipes TaxID=94469 RepID=UPI002892CC57|nr:uncharacterized protein LOC132255357 [Phlebotomus argentipes]